MGNWMLNMIVQKRSVHHSDDVAYQVCPLPYNRRLMALSYPLACRLEEFLQAVPGEVRARCSRWDAVRGPHHLALIALHPADLCAIHHCP
jgi:hypothetical protein